MMMIDLEAEPSVELGTDDDNDRIEFGTLAEQRDEADYDDRIDADDDLGKGRIKFPKDKLYGRDAELRQLQDIYSGMCGKIAPGTSLRRQSSLHKLKEEDEDPAAEPTRAQQQQQQLPPQPQQNRRVVFLGGFSGTGKTTLIQHFVRQISQQHKQLPTPIYIEGKFSQLQSGDPFSAMAQGWNAHILKWIHLATPEQLAKLYKRLRRADLTLESEWTAVLQQTLLPNLPDLLEHIVSVTKTTTASSTSSRSEGSNKSDPQQHDANTLNSSHVEDETAGRKRLKMSTASLEMSTITYAFSHFLRAVCTSQQPLVWMVDDLQWADAASFQLIKTLLTANDIGRCHMLFVGAYRSNEVTDLKPFEELQEKVAAAARDEESAVVVTQMEISTLTPDHVGQFIADSIRKDTTEIEPITEAVYTKTLGNIFFVQQALEELVRQNAIYYDVMCFEWRFGDISRVALEDSLSDDVVQLVQNKLLSLPPSLSQALAVAALTKQSFDITWLSPLVAAVQVAIRESGETKDDNDMDNNNNSEEKDTSSIPALQKLMKLAFDEGLVLHDNAAVGMAQVPKRGQQQWLGFKFAHDRIREAACNTVPKGTDEYDVVLKSIATVLLDQYDRMNNCRSTHSGNNNYTTVTINEDIDWMMFTAVSHLNSISPRHIQAVPVAELNLKVGKLAIAKGAFDESSVFFRAGVERLENYFGMSVWKDHYDLILALYNDWLESEHTLGHYDRANFCVDKVINHATSLGDKLRAQRIYLMLQCGPDNRAYKEAVDPGLEILSLYGVDIPEKPTEKQIRREKFRLQLALRGRNLMCLSTFPIASETPQPGVPEKGQPAPESPMAEEEHTEELSLTSSKKGKTAPYTSDIAGPLIISHITLRNAWLGGRPEVVQMLGHRMLRLALAHQTITKNLAFVLMALGSPSVREEKYERAFLFANASQAILDRFPREKSQDFLMSKVILYSALIVLRLPFRDAIEPFMDMYKGLLAVGDSDTSFGSAMNGMMLYFIAAMPLGSMMEPRLLLYEEAATNLGKSSFITVFGLYRQMLYNLQGGIQASPNPCEIDGPAASERAIVAKSEGPSAKMNNRDIGIIRLQLAVIFSDAEAMEEQLKRLDPYPIFDPPFPRQYWRMTYMGIAALILSRNPNYGGYRRRESCTQLPFVRKREKELIPKWADACLDFFEKLSGFGSPNAQPVYACLKALDKPKIAAFDNAIDVAGNYGLLNLVALMNERCALWLLEECPFDDEKNTFLATEYLKVSMWCYHDWGALNKVNQLERQYSVLAGAMRSKPPSALSSTRRQAYALGVRQSAAFSVSSD